MFESIFSTTTETSFSISSSILAMAVAIVLGLIIGITYMYACRNDGYGKDFIIGLVVLPAVVAVVILLVGSNVARAFSMAGAFALVRFRSAPGSAKDIAVVFFTMAAGLACGLGFVYFAVVFVILIAMLLIILSFTKFGEQNQSRKQLRITIPENLNYENAFNDIFDKYFNDIKLVKSKTTNMGTMFELQYFVTMKNNCSEKQLMDELRVRNGNLNITMGLLTADGNQLN